MSTRKLDSPPPPIRRSCCRGEAPRLIDEWQLEPAIWNHVRRAVDDRRASGQFILTGSAVPPTTRPVTPALVGSAASA